MRAKGDEEAQTSRYKVSREEIMHSTVNMINNIVNALYSDR